MHADLHGLFCLYIQCEPVSTHGSLENGIDLISKYHALHSRHGRGYQLQRGGTSQPGYSTPTIRPKLG